MYTEIQIQNITRKMSYIKFFQSEFLKKDYVYMCWDNIDPIITCNNLKLYYGHDVLSFYIIVNLHVKNVEKIIKNKFKKYAYSDNIFAINIYSLQKKIIAYFGKFLFFNAQNNDSYCFVFGSETSQSNEVIAYSDSNSDSNSNSNSNSDSDSNYNTYAKHSSVIELSSESDLNSDSDLNIHRMKSIELSSESDLNSNHSLNYSSNFNRHKNKQFKLRELKKSKLVKLCDFDSDTDFDSNFKSKSNFESHNKIKKKLPKSISILISYK